MTVSSTTNRNSFTCTGVQEFPFDFKIFAKTDLVVILRDTEGEETTLTLTTDYTISAGPWETGGTLTTVKSYTSGTLVIIRELPQTQGMDYVENDPFPADTHEQGLDRGVMILQELTEKIARMLILAKSSSYSELTLPDPVASKLLAWKDDLSGIKNVEIKNQGDLSVTDYIKTLLDDEDASAALTTLGVSTFIKTLLDDADAATALITLGLTATKEEINTVCDAGNNFHSPLSISPAAFVPYRETYDWMIAYNQLRNYTSIGIQDYSAGLTLPHGVIVSKLTLYGDRDDALAEMSLRLHRSKPGEASQQMAEIVADWVSGASSGYDDSIDYATIDNNDYQYALDLRLDPNDAATDVMFLRAKIDFTY